MSLRGVMTTRTSARGRLFRRTGAVARELAGVEPARAGALAESRVRLPRSPWSGPTRSGRSGPDRVWQPRRTARWRWSQAGHRARRNGSVLAVGTLNLHAPVQVAAGTSEALSPSIV